MTAIGITDVVSINSLPNITGSVNVTNTLFNVTGSVRLTEPIDITIGPVTGSVGITNFPLIQQITGSVGIDGISFPEQITVTGSVGITNAISVNSLPNITGSVNVTNTLFNVTGSVRLTEPITGSVGITNAISVNSLPNITGSVNVTNTLFNVTGSVRLTEPITGSVRLTEPITGSVNVTNTLFNVTGSVNVTNTLFNVTGSVGITNTIGITTTGSLGLQVANNPASPLFTILSSSIGTLANVASSASSVTLLSANTARRGATIFNDSTQLLYVKFGTTASTTSFTIRMATLSYYEVPFGYTGRIDGIWSVANGNARVTEVT